MEFRTDSTSGPFELPPPLPQKKPTEHSEEEVKEAEAEKQPLLETGPKPPLAERASTLRVVPPATPTGRSPASPSMSMGPRLHPSRLQKNAATIIGISGQDIPRTMARSSTTTDLQSLAQEEDKERSQTPSDRSRAPTLTSHKVTPESSSASASSTSTASASPSRGRIATFIGKVFSWRQGETKESGAAAKKEPKITDKTAKKAWNTVLINVMAKHRESDPKKNALFKIFESITFTPEDLKFIRDHQDTFVGEGYPGGAEWVQQALKNPALRKIITIIAVWNEYASDDPRKNVDFLLKEKSLNTLEEQDATALIEFIDHIEHLPSPDASLETRTGYADALDKKMPETLNLQYIATVKPRILADLKSDDPERIKEALRRLQELSTEAANITYNNAFGQANPNNTRAREALDALLKGLSEYPLK